MRSNTETLRTRKDSLARLLATEDLVIEHKKVPTAYLGCYPRTNGENTTRHKGTFFYIIAT